MSASSPQADLHTPYDPTPRFKGAQVFVQFVRLNTLTPGPFLELVLIPLLRNLIRLCFVFNLSLLPKNLVPKTAKAKHI